MLFVKTKYVRCKAKQIFRLVTTSCFACFLPALLLRRPACGGSAAPSAEAASARWCSRRRRATGTTRSPRAWPRSERLGRDHRFSVDTTADAGGSPRANWPATTSSSSCRRPARRSQALPSSVPSRASSAAAAATSACTRRPTRAAVAVVRAAGRRALQAPRAGHAGRDRDTSRTATTAATRGLPEPGRARRVVRVPLARRARARAREPRRARPLAWCHRYDGGRSVYTAMGHTEGVLRRAALRRATCSARSRWPPAARGSAVRPEPARARVRDRRGAGLAGCGGDEPPPSRPRPDRGADRGADRPPTERADAAARRPATARAPRSTRSRSTPATARSWSAPAPRCSASTPGAKEAERITGTLSTDGAAPSRATSSCASPARATCSPPGTRRRASCPRTWR